MGVPQLKPLPRNTPESSSQTAIWSIIPVTRRQTSPDISESQKKQEEGPRKQRLSGTQHSHPRLPRRRGLKRPFFSLETSVQERAPGNEHYDSRNESLKYHRSRAVKMGNKRTREHSRAGFNLCRPKLRTKKS